MFNFSPCLAARLSTVDLSKVEARVATNEKAADCDFGGTRFALLVDSPDDYASAMALCSNELTAIEFASSFVPLLVPAVLHDVTIAKKLKGVTFVSRKDASVGGISDRLTAALTLTNYGAKGITLRDAVAALMKIRSEQKKNGAP